MLERARNAGIVKGMSYVIHQGNGTAYSRYGIGSAWSRACARAGVKGVTTRHLRPKATTDASRQGYSITELQATLVHASAGTRNVQKFHRQKMKANIRRIFPQSRVARSAKDVGRQDRRAAGLEVDDNP